MPLDIITYSKLKKKADLINGKIPAHQLPDFVDDVIVGYLSNGVFYEDVATTIPITGDTGKIYLDTTDNLNDAYIYMGNNYVQILSPGISTEDFVIEDPE
ncbi:MAG: hypothetical protein M0Q88_00930 [Bacilli bacterium]|nr:hypothetical protein [Bacilli bacterium]